MKSYGRAPPFLMRTGYQQVRSVVAAFTGSPATYDEVNTVNACSASHPISQCCVTPASSLITISKNLAKA